jgi:selenocysteine-specific translation elongation factor
MAKKKTVIERKKLTPVKKKRKLSEEAKEKLRIRLAAMRAKKKPADYKNVAQSVLNLPDDDKYSFKSVKEWIKHSKDLVLEYNKVARSRASSSQAAQKASNSADHKKVYIRELENYLKTGDYISYFSGKDENQKVIPMCIAQSFYEDGRAKRDCGVYYPDINAVWTRDMDEDMFPDMREDTNYVPKKSGTVAITDRQFDDSL